MSICKQCGVELDDQMDVCPLCDTPVKTDSMSEKAATREESPVGKRKRNNLLQQVIWQVICVLLFSGIAATLIINLSIQRTLSWSIYPVTVCMIMLSYASLMALWHTKTIVQVLAGWLISSAMLILLNPFVASQWPLRLVLPMLFSANVIGLLLGLILKNVKVKGLNVIAVTFIAIAVLCLMIEGIISVYLYNEISFKWSVIVAACILPVTAAIFFMHYRSRNNNELQKIFHS